jgi:hypothetical protein
VALGDSYSAGVGSGGTSGACGQKSNAYPVLWAASHPAYQFTFAACSEASVDAVASGQLKEIPAGATLVTITVGGDPYFAFYIALCSVPTAQADRLCSLASQAAQAYASNFLEASLVGLYASILARAPSARIITLGYPDFFPGNALCGGSDHSEQADVNKTIDVLDAAIAKAATATGSTFVDVRLAFAAHELCTQAPWLTGIIPASLGNSFHPNQAGQAQGYEAALTAVTG